MRLRSLTHPVPDVQETLLTRQIEHEQKTHRIPEERRGQTPEPEPEKKAQSLISVCVTHPSRPNQTESKSK